MYRYKSVDVGLTYLDDALKDINEIYCPFSIYILLKICISLLVIVRDYFRQKGL